jgi:hypothetical protein
MRFAAPAAAALVVLAAGCSCCKTSPGASAAPPAQARPEAEAEFNLPVEVEIRFVKPSKDYPLATCVVTGDDLGMGGEPVAIVYDGTEIQFCCNHCVADFKKDPAKYVGMVRRATPAPAPAR